jgi:hypothetical protein
MSDVEAMLEAHVRFELDRLSPERLPDTVAEDVDELYEWLGQARLREVADPGVVAAAVVDAARSLEPATLASTAVVLARSVQRELAATDDTLGDLVSEEEARRWAEAVAGLDDARRALVTAVTSSRTYSRLVAHVVYSGIKSYVLTENVLTRRIPGASSLVRLGQRSLGAAAPGLESSVDRQLIAFVDANIADTIRDSRRFLDGELDTTTVSAAARQFWAEAADTPVSSSSDLLSPDELGELADLAVHQWVRLRDSATFADAARAAVDSYVEAHGDETLVDVLTDLGLTREVVTDLAVTMLRPTLDHARSSGALEARVRRRLEPFYRAQG